MRGMGRAVTAGMLAIALAGCASAPAPGYRDPFPEPRGWPVVGAEAIPAASGAAGMSAGRAVGAVRPAAPRPSGPVPRRIGSGTPPPVPDESGNGYRARIDADLRSLGEDQRGRVESEAASGATASHRLAEDARQRFEADTRRSDDLRRQLDQNQLLLRQPRGP